MNNDLQKIFSIFYTPALTNNQVEGASSELGTRALRDKIVDLFARYSISSIFDAGCNDCNWMQIISQYVNYKGGDISLAMVADVWRWFPDLDVIVHDITTDPIPDVDLLFVRDVAIHLNNKDKLCLWKNWMNNNVPWILITHNKEVTNNEDALYVRNKLPFAAANWELAPWNFPPPLDFVDEYGPGGRCLGLWHRDQLKGIL